MKKQVYNPYLPLWEYIPDGEPRVFGDRLYIYGSHDRFGGKWYCENDYVTWSAPVCDLSDWRYEGIIYKKENDPREGNLFAPDCVRGYDGKYYLYYSKDDTSVISVAESDDPAGEFSYLGDVHYENGELLGGEGDYFMFDPSVLMDDGRVWLYSGSSVRGTNTGIKRNMAGCTVTELCPDMITVKKAPRVVLPGCDSWESDAFFEGPSARKIGELYYIVYPVRDFTGLHYAVSRCPDRDFRHMGTVISSSGIGINGTTAYDPDYPIGNEHGGLVEIGGRWYIFSHKNTNGDNYSRHGIAEPVEIEPDGTIRQVILTSCGLNGKPLKDCGTYPAAIACLLRGGAAITQSGADGDENCEHYVKNITDGAAVGYRYFGFRGGEYTLRVMTRGGEGNLTVSVGESTAAIPIIPGEEWHPAAASLSVSSGTHSVLFTYNGTSPLDLHSFEIKHK